MTQFDELVNVSDVLEQDNKERRALTYLLDKQAQKQGHLCAIQARMGKTRSFISAGSLEWVAQKVRFATELPLFTQYLDPATNKIILNRKSAEIVQQRQPDPRRQFPMTLYLAKRTHHKFPAMLLVNSQAWVDEPTHDNWSSDGRATRDSINAQQLDTEGRYFDLRLGSDDFLYALDGQHRLMSLKGLVSLVSEGFLFAKKEDGRQTAQKITVDEIVEDTGGRISHSFLQQLLSERIGFEIIPAVQKGETRKEALQRIRSIFVHVNRNAVTLTKGEIALLDEDDGFAVVARMAMVTDPLLRDRVQLKKGQLASSSSDFTTLETLLGIAKGYLGQFSQFQAWRPDSKWEMSTRPEEESLDAGEDALARYLELLAKLPSHQEMIQGKGCKEIRDESGNLLFRPLGQLALADALGTLVAEGKRTLEVAIEALGEKEAAGQLDMRNKLAPWYGVIFDPNSETMQRSASAQTLCTRLFVHMLGGGTADDQLRKTLRDDFAKARIVDTEKNLAVDLKGDRVTPDRVELPPPWV